MKKTILSILTALVLVINLISCGSAQTSKEITKDSETESVDLNSVKPFSDLGLEEWKVMSEQQLGIILDVRTPEEVALGKIPQAIDMNFMADNFAEEVAKLDTSKPIYVYCASGGRSSRAMDMMKGLGFEKVYNLKGGFSNWTRHNQPVEE